MDAGHHDGVPLVTRQPVTLCLVIV